MKNKLYWYFNRLKSMSLSEVRFRINQQIVYKQNRKNIDYNKPVTISYTQNKILNIPASLTIPCNWNYHIFHNSFNYLNVENWNYDFYSDKSFPLTYSFDINIRNEKYGSAKIVWEYNRLQFLTYLCLQYKVTNNIEYLRQFEEIITSWINKNPYLRGVNWYSNIEVNLRLITWFLCWEILDAAALIKEEETFRKFTEAVWLPSVYKHCLYSHSFPSKYSSANNHLISEYAGLFIATSLWHFENSKQWNEYAKKGLEEEIQKQYSEKGVNKEEAAEYIQFITDFFLLAQVVAEKTNNSFSEAYSNRLKNIFQYIHDFLDCRSNFPKYGDEDDGKCFILDFNKHSNNFKSLLTSGVILFQSSQFKKQSAGFDLKNAILFGDAGRHIFEAVTETDSNCHSAHYYNEGHFIFRKRTGNKEIYLHFDAAPLGFLSIAAHGHADALSIILNIDGEPVLVDPGTFTYHTHPYWRKYFIGTLAHNTIRVDKKDQAQIGGPTLWLNHYKTKVLSFETKEDFETVTAQHNGYKDLGINHTRKVFFNKKEDEIVIEDDIENKRKKPVLLEMPFHIHPETKIKQSDINTFQLQNNKCRSVQLVIDKKLSVQTVHGKENGEPLGWYSDSFMQKVPSPVIYSSLFTNQTVNFKTVIKINPQ